jgi:hypothetical protein
MMQYRVLKDFTTPTRRYKAGTVVDEHDIAESSQIAVKDHMARNEIEPATSPVRPQRELP